MEIWDSWRGRGDQRSLLGRRCWLRPFAARRMGRARRRERRRRMWRRGWSICWRERRRRKTRRKRKGEGRWNQTPRIQTTMDGAALARDPKPLTGPRTLRVPRATQTSATKRLWGRRLQRNLALSWSFLSVKPRSRWTGGRSSIRGPKKGYLTSGIKISTHFALLIRPYYNNSSPLLRELYALGQTIDQLRAGLLLQTADSLASRFIAVHQALSEGGWQTASQLEMFPLEPVQSVGTSTLLAAQKHKKLIQKSQGTYYPQVNWWGQAGKGRGAQKGEKGKKGEYPKGKQKGKGRGGGKNNQWWQGLENPWKDNKEDAAKKTPEKSSWSSGGWSYPGLRNKDAPRE